MNDEPIHPLDKTVFYVEYMMRHKGADFMKSPAMALNWFQLESVDVYAFIITCIVTLILILWSCLKCVFRFICGRDRKMKNE